MKKTYNKFGGQKHFVFFPLHQCITIVTTLLGVSILRDALRVSETLLSFSSRVSPSLLASGKKRSADQLRKGEFGLHLQRQ